MTQHQKGAYVALMDTGDRLRTLCANAQSLSHPLNLSDETIDAIGVALIAIHAAQREIEKELHKKAV